jgi:exopolysaccharide biosynthesis polyprenyl glycosylphosphotransferase
MRHLLKAPNGRTKAIIFLGDVIALTSAAALIVIIRGLFKESHIWNVSAPYLNLYVIFFSIPLYLITLYICETYDPDKRRKSRYAAVPISAVTVAAILAVFVLERMLIIGRNATVRASFYFIIAAILLFFWRVVFEKIFLGLGCFAKNIIFLGKDPLTEKILSKMRAAEYKVITGPRRAIAKAAQSEEDANGVIETEKIEEIIKLKNIDIIVLALNSDISSSVLGEIHKSKSVYVYKSDYFYEILTKKVAIEQYLDHERAFKLNTDAAAGLVFKNTKRLADLFGSLAGLCLSAPLFLIIAILIKLTSRGRVFYVQDRIGVNGKPFKLIKFRTMIPEAEKDSGPRWASKDDSRVTAVGRFLRKTRLDELPQMLNVIKGELSLVGPRPIRKHFAHIIQRELPFYSFRFNVKPGITGWAQVNHDYGGTIEGHIEKFQYDLYYIKHASLFLDLFIIIKTLQTMIRRPAY